VARLTARGGHFSSNQRLDPPASSSVWRHWAVIRPTAVEMAAVSFQCHTFSCDRLTAATFPAPYPPPPAHSAGGGGGAASPPPPAGAGPYFSMSFHLPSSPSRPTNDLITRLARRGVRVGALSTDQGRTPPDEATIHLIWARSKHASICTRTAAGPHAPPTLATSSLQKRSASAGPHAPHTLAMSLRLVLTFCRANKRRVGATSRWCRPGVRRTCCTDRFNSALRQTNRRRHFQRRRQRMGCESWFSSDTRACACTAQAREWESVYVSMFCGVTRRWACLWGNTKVGMGLRGLTKDCSRCTKPEFGGFERPMIRVRLTLWHAPRGPVMLPWPCAPVPPGPRVPMRPECSCIRAPRTCRLTPVRFVAERPRQRVERERDDA
jgi:hypothetical protein